MTCCRRAFPEGVLMIYLNEVSEVEEEEKFMFEEQSDEFKFFPKRGDRAEIT